MWGQLPGAEMGPGPAFEAPGEGQLFALTVHLKEGGVLAWPDWAQRFGATLAAHGLDKALSGGDDYFAAWLETLEGMVGDLGHATPEALQSMRAAWERAYLAPPHGQPVHLE